ncbi:hypothetical protein D9M72_584320 [compost metagenome]
MERLVGFVGSLKAVQADSVFFVEDWLSLAGWAADGHCGCVNDLPGIDDDVRGGRKAWEVVGVAHGRLLCSSSFNLSRPPRRLQRLRPASFVLFFYWGESGTPSSTAYPTRAVIQERPSGVSGRELFG